ncbi:IS200/IS605 family accessory protein TnpB-related protein, partial [Lactobacillus helveticus]
MIKLETPSLIVKEDLTFTKEKIAKKGSKYERQVRRNLSSWTKGILNERLEYYCQQYGIDFKDVNPAYT